MTTPSTQRNPHNPGNLTPAQVGPLHRLAYEDERETLKNNESVEVWYSTKSKWTSRKGIGESLHAHITYRIPLTLAELQWRPITEPPTETDASKSGEILGIFSDNLLQTLPWRSNLDLYAMNYGGVNYPLTHWLPLSWLPPVPAPPDPFTKWHNKFMPGVSEADARKAWEGARG